MMNKAEQLRTWRRRLEVVADEMETEGYEVMAEHLDIIIGDCQFEEQAFAAGAEVIFKNFAREK